ncbi:hypothetical protein FA95DRAFT_1034860 [Auriscalpium vulgare]|uniref:Uncharacterized protein n=1 Tax=Auriscalpium vulgare TaxID=40419 RepID=A0ACB8RY86_9AGAM|nr:hypothetical protein FA95DRAFT_1034860 [Auriscalpium vulgare]
MPPLPCGHPASAADYDPAAGSLVCTSCGTLADAAGAGALTSAADFPNDAYAAREPAYARPSVLKSVVRRGADGGAGWDLAGQGKAARHERNTFAMHESLRTLAARLGHPGLAPRAAALFDTALARSEPRIRWGRPATLAAGAVLVLALREAGGRDATHDLAYLLSEPPTALTRAQTRLRPLLGLALPRAPPTAHLPSLAAHLSALLASDPPTSALPADTRAFLRPLLAPAALPDVLRTADGLYALLCQGDAEKEGTEEGHPLLALPLPPLAPALLVLALEAHAQPPRAAPHVMELAAQLGARLGLGSRAVMERYRALGDVVAHAAQAVPWLSAAHGKSGKAKSGKAAARRVGVARAVRDVVQFRAEIWAARLRADGAVHVDLEGELSDGEVASQDGQGQGQYAAGEDTQVLGKRMADDASGAETSRAGAAKAKKKKRAHTAVGRATSFLLNPLAASVSVSDAPPASTSTSTSASAPPPRDAGISLAHTAHLLAPDAALSAHPTRLQLLSTARGGEAAIADEELFAEGEMEGMLLGEAEAGDDEDAAAEREDRAALLWAMWGNEKENGTNDGEAKRLTKEERLRERAGRRGKGRFDAARLAALLGDPDALAEQDEDEDEDGLVRGGASPGFGIWGDGGGEEVGEWVPMSPGGASAEWLEDVYDA